MTNESPFADWYAEGQPLPVCHPIPHCSATIKFPDPGTLVWEVTDHKNEKSYTERFEFTDNPELMEDWKAVDADDKRATTDDE